MKVVRVRVTPSQKKEQVVAVDTDVYHLSVTVPAERNQANDRAREIIAEVYETSPRAVRILSGHRAKTKRFEIVDT